MYNAKPKVVAVDSQKQQGGNGVLRLGEDR